jgi:dipeptidyl aminopeptidase/acylaminoacyl peptidase
MGYEIEHEGAASDSVAYWREYLGEHSDPTLVDRSPNRNAEHITRPVLLIYSADDIIVSPNQSQLLGESLQKLGRNVQLIEIPNADHALTQPGARLRAMEEIEKFLQNHL